MRNLLILIGTISIGVGTVGGGCETTKTCALIGCQDQFSAGVSSVNGQLPSGMHRVELLVDGVTMMCTFTIPLPGGGTGQPTCPAGMNVLITPAADAQVEIITISGAPGQVHAWQYVDDVAILDAAVAPTYHDNQPNGPGCDPTCRQASASWSLLP